MKPKKLPRLWCAWQGLLPLEAYRAAQRAEPAWAPDLIPSVVAPPASGTARAQAIRARSSTVRK